MRKLLALLFALAVIPTALFSSAEAANPGWIVGCAWTHTAQVDPIVSPGAVPSAHLHDFVGAVNTDQDSTPDSLRAGGTSCKIAGDSSAYWVPSLYIHADTTPVAVLPNGTANHDLFYYRCVVGPCASVQTIPDGLKMVMGNSHATSPADNPQIGTGRIFWKCGPGSATHLASPPAQCASTPILSLSLVFPNCWDGIHLDSADHISHMAYPVGSKCPADHPVNLPRIQAFFRYNVGTAPLGTVALSSGPWYTAHMDFMNAWIPAALTSLVTKCIDAGIDCGKDPQP